MTAALRRSRGRDPLGLRRAMADRLLPAVVAAMALLAALAFGAAQGAARLAERWQAGAATLTVELAADDDAAAAIATLAALPGVAAATPVDPARLTALLRPWLGQAPLPELPAMLELRPTDPGADPAAVAAAVMAAWPSATVSLQGAWTASLLALARTAGRLALATLALVGAVAAAVIAVAVRAGLAARREQIAILHHLGATDGAIAGRFAARIAQLAAVGAAAGSMVAAPLLAALGALAAPLVGAAAAGTFAWRTVPWASLLLLPAIAAAIGWLVAQGSVRGWLWRLP